MERSYEQERAESRRTKSKYHEQGAAKSVESDMCLSSHKLRGTEIPGPVFCSPTVVLHCCGNFVCIVLSAWEKPEPKCLCCCKELPHVDGSRWYVNDHYAVSSLILKTICIPF